MFLRPDSVTPVNLLDGSLISYTLSERQASLPTGLALAQCKWDRRHANEQKDVKRASN